MALSAGIDIGNATSCVALAKGTAIDVVLNRDGQRETPTAMYYGNTARTVGLKSSSRFVTQPRSTVVQSKRLIGRHYADIHQQEGGMLLYDVTDGGTQQQGHCMISVPAPANSSVPLLQLRPEQVLATVLKQLSSMAEMNAGAEITKHALSIPCFYGQAERAAMLAAAKVAGLTDVTLIHELTATALCWGVAKRNLPDKQPKHVAFVDVGHSATQACIAAFTKSSVEILAHSWNSSCGGRDMDAMLVSHFADEFRKASGLDVMHDAKALAKLTLKVTKCRELLTGGKSAQINIDSLMKDQDFSATITMDSFESMCASLMARVQRTLQSVLHKARLRPSDVKVIEKVGGASRTPAVVRVIQEVFQLEKSSRQPKSTMNHKECVARGCALRAAMLLGKQKGQISCVKDIYPFDALGQYVTPNRGEIRKLEVLKAGHQLGVADNTLALRPDRCMETVNGELVVYDDIVDGQPSSSQGHKPTVHVKLTGKNVPAVHAKSGLSYHFREWQVKCGRDADGVLRIADQAKLVYRAGTHQSTHSCATSADPPHSSKPSEQFQVFSHPVHVLHMLTVPQELVDHWAHIEKQMEEQDHHQTKVDQARNDLEGYVHVCDSRLRCEWDVALPHADHTVRSLKYHLEEARWAIGFVESDPEVYFVKMKALKAASEDVGRRIETMQKTAQTDSCKHGGPPGQPSATAMSPVAKQVSAHPIGLDCQDTEHEPSPLQDKVNQLICTFSAVDPLWLDTVSETSLGIVLTDWLDHNMQFWTRTLRTLQHATSETSCALADTVAVCDVPDEPGAEQEEDAVSHGARHFRRHTFCKGPSSKAKSDPKQC